MEFTDYLAAIRRNWRIWIGITVLAFAVSGGALALTPRTYQATAQVFASAQPSIANSAQFAQQRAQSYPDVATSATVLDSVVSDLGLHESTVQLRSTITATVPSGTSQVDITVSDRDPKQAADIANSVAEHMTKVVQRLETPASGVRPVTLTVSNPATVPGAPSSPKAAYVLGLGLLVGLFLGLAAAVLRGRFSTAIHDEDDVRAAWGAESGLDVLTPRRGRARRSALTGDPAAALARRLEFTAEERRVRVAFLSPAPGEQATAAEFADAVAARLEHRGLAATVADAPVGGRALTDTAPGALITLADPLAAPAFWRQVAERYDGVVLVVPRDHADAAELREMRVVLRAAGIETLAIVVTPRRRRRSQAKRADLAVRVPRAADPADLLNAPAKAVTTRESMPAGRGDSREPVPASNGRMPQRPNGSSR